ncbi:hypothetical protein SMALB_4271 [Streptomyces malaysiensis]|uniref:Uncharacterized protein n=1 Tax=Streptomyces malaysiensis TaxID=92644 RepID=A0A7X5X6F2_STRMQ|nr:hypothetical protein [Streptomyces malaysiensis]
MTTAGPDRSDPLPMRAYGRGASSRLPYATPREVGRHGPRTHSALPGTPGTARPFGPSPSTWRFSPGIRQVEEVCARTSHSQRDVIGHNLGGLIARHYVQRLGGDTRAHTLVTLGTPHAGTRIAPLLSAPVVRTSTRAPDVPGLRGDNGVAAACP